VQRRASGLVVFTYSAAISACEKGRQHRQTVHLLCAVQRHVVVLGVIAYAVAITACGVVSSTSRFYFLASDVPPCHRAECHRLQRCIRVCEKGR